MTLQDIGLVIAHIGVGSVILGVIILGLVWVGIVVFGLWDYYRFKFKLRYLLYFALWCAAAYLTARVAIP